MSESPMEFGSGDAPTPRERALAATALGTALLQAAPLLFFFIAARRLSPDAAGMVRILLVLQGLAGLAACAGMPEALLHRLGAAPTEAGRIRAAHGAGIWLIVTFPLASALTTAAVWLVATLARRPEFIALLPVAALIGSLGSVSHFAGPALAARGRSAAFLGAASLHALLLTIAGLAAPPAAAPMLAAAWLAGLPLTVWVIRGLGTPDRTRVAEMRMEVAAALRYGAPLAGGAVLYLLAYQVDHFTASRMLTPIDYGLYAAGAWQLPAGTVLQLCQRYMLLPALAELSREGRYREFWALWRRVAAPALTAGSLLFWLAFWNSEDGLTLLLGSRYAGAGDVFRVYACLLPLQLIAVALPLWASGSTRWDVPAAGIFVVTSLAAGILLTPVLGRVGPAVGLAIGYLSWSLSLTAITSRVLRTPFWNLAPLAPLARGLVIGGAAAAVLRGAVQLAASGSSAGRLALTAIAVLGWIAWEVRRQRRLSRGGSLSGD